MEGWSVEECSGASSALMSCWARSRAKVEGVASTSAKN